MIGQSGRWGAGNEQVTTIELFSFPSVFKKSDCLDYDLSFCLSVLWGVFLMACVDVCAYVLYDVFMCLLLGVCLLMLLYNMAGDCHCCVCSPALSYTLAVDVPAFGVLRCSFALRLVSLAIY